MTTTEEFPELEDLTTETAREKLAELSAEIERHDRAYHQNDAPEITDAEYDRLRRLNTVVPVRFREKSGP